MNLLFLFVLIAVYVFAVFRKNIMGQPERTYPGVPCQHHIAAGFQLDPPVAGMPLFRRGTLENPVAGEGQTAAGQGVKQGRIRDIEGIADNADILVEGLIMPSQNWYMEDRQTSVNTLSRISTSWHSPDSNQ